MSSEEGNKAFFLECRKISPKLSNPNHFIYPDRTELAQDKFQHGLGEKR
jgi:hypothetical protein